MNVSEGRPEKHAQTLSEKLFLAIRPDKPDPCCAGAFDSDAHVVRLSPGGAPPPPRGSTNQAEQTRQYIHGLSGRPTDGFTLAY